MKLGLQIDALERQAVSLRDQACNGQPEAMQRFDRMKRPPATDLQGAMQVVAGEQGFSSWAHLRTTSWIEAASEADRVKRLRSALAHGQSWITSLLLDFDDRLASADFGIETAMFDRPAVLSKLRSDPGIATRKFGTRRPILHLAFSRRLAMVDDIESATADMLAIADALVTHGASANDSFRFDQSEPHRLSALYGAIGHSGNIALGKWLLDNGADPNDGESLYHSTELETNEGTELLLSRGARVDGTNALLRALDFNKHETVEMMLAAGADPNWDVAEHPGSEPTMVVPALHQAARRMCDSDMARILLNAGADCSKRHFGHTPYAYARMYGNSEIASEIERAGGASELSEHELLLARIADGRSAPRAGLNSDDFSGETRYILCNILQFPDRLEHAKLLVEADLNFDAPDEMGVTPVQLAGWLGLPSAMEWLLSLRPDLKHVNGFGGDLLSTIIHGSENCPERESRQHVECTKIALSSGVPLHSEDIDHAAREDMINVLASHAAEHPDMVNARRGA